MTGNIKTISPIAKYEALDCIIDKAVIASVIIIRPRILVILAFDLRIQPSTNGILSAIEKTAMFLFAVTPLRLPEFITPELSSISKLDKK